MKEIIKMKEIRINKISCRKYPDRKRKGLYEIVAWETNFYFGKIQDYLNIGYVESFGGGYLTNGNHSIDKSFFSSSPESCYVIAFLRKGKESWTLESVGNRILDLTEEEFKDFMLVYRNSIKN